MAIGFPPTPKFRLFRLAKLRPSYGIWSDGVLTRRVQRLLDGMGTVRYMKVSNVVDDFSHLVHVTVDMN